MNNQCGSFCLFVIVSALQHPVATVLSPVSGLLSPLHVSTTSPLCSSSSSFRVDGQNG